MTKLGIGAALAVVLCTSQVAHAFCGLYLAADGAPRLGDATEVVVMRKGTRTVLSMQNSYVGPAEPFAFVVPVPAAVQARDISIVDRGAFDAVERLGAPRLAEYWEQDPCASTHAAPTPIAARGTTADVGPPAEPDTEDPDVILESQLAAGEYQIAIVAAKDAAGLEAWLRREKYQLPAGAQPLLRDYLERGMKLLVAKVDPKRVAFAGGRAVLSPLRVSYESEQLVLPIRLGLANSPGTQDLLVNVLAPERHEAASYPNVTIPTNLAVTSSVRDQFGAFYAALFDATLDKYPDAVVTEYVWDASSCDPCTGPPLSTGHLEALGADVLGDASSFVLTRLHARYGKGIEHDLVLRPAPPIAGGRERILGSGMLERGAHPAPANGFEARYTIRHAWLGPLTCEHPVRDRWSTKPGSVKPALDLAHDLAFASRGGVELATLVQHDVPALDLTVRENPLEVVPATVPATAPANSGVGCASTTGEMRMGMVIVALLVVRRRKAARAG